VLPLSLAAEDCRAQDRARATSADHRKSRVQVRPAPRAP
jgi:hypothetical protein